MRATPVITWNRVVRPLLLVLLALGCAHIQLVADFDEKTHPDARLDQLRFERLFTAAVAAEAAKHDDRDRNPPAADGS